MLLCQQNEGRALWERLARSAFSASVMQEFPVGQVHFPKVAEVDLS